MPVRLGVAIAAVLVGAVLGAFSLIAARAGAGFSFAGESLWGAAILLIPGLAMFGVGAIYLSRRSGLLLGLLLSLTGAAWFIVEWDNPAVGSPLAFTAGLLLYAACPALVLHVVLAYPTGRLRSNLDRLVVVSGYLVTVVDDGPDPDLVLRSRLQGCATCPDNLAVVWSDPSRLNQAGVVGDEGRPGVDRPRDRAGVLALRGSKYGEAPGHGTHRRARAPLPRLRGLEVRPEPG